MKGSKNNLKMSNNLKMPNNRSIVCCCVVVLILVGLYFLVQKKNMLEGFESQPMELNNLTEKPNPKADDVVIVLFYVDWCPHCVSSKPEWANVVAKHNNTKVNGKNVKVQACNCEGSEAEKETASDNSIQGYPTIKAIKNNEVVEYSGARNAASIETFIQEQCGV